jgi:hypothetical protein
MMKVFNLLVAICAIAAINWSLTVWDANLIELITPEGSDLRMIREPLYYVISAAGLLVLGQVLGLKLFKD